MTHLLTLSDSQYKAKATSELVVLVSFFFLICLAELLSVEKELLTHKFLDAEKITSACHQIMKHILAFFFFLSFILFFIQCLCKIPLFFLHG